MVIAGGTELGSNVIVKTLDGFIVNGVKWFDTETKKAELYATVVLNNGIESKTKRYPDQDKLEMPTFQCTLYDCKAYDKKTGNELK